MANPASIRRGAVIAILGMHRSGTSLCARAVNLLGASLGSDLLAPRADNPKGYFEDRKVVEINSKILRLLFAPLHEEAYPLAVQMRPWPLPDGWLKHPGIMEFRAAALEHVRAATAGPEPWCVKDPRLCRLFPFWEGIFKELGLQTRIVLAIRHPAHVAASLAARDGFMPHQAELQWLAHNLDALHYARPEVIVDYDEWFSDPTDVIVRLATGLDLAPDQNRIAAALANVDGAARHYAPDNEITHPFAAAAWKILHAARRGGLELPALLRMRSALLEAFKLLPGCYDELAFAAKQQKRLMAQIRQMQSGEQNG